MSTARLQSAVITIAKTERGLVSPYECELSRRCRARSSCVTFSFLLNTHRVIQRNVTTTTTTIAIITCFTRAGASPERDRDREGALRALISTRSRAHENVHVCVCVCLTGHFLHTEHFSTFRSACGKCATTTAVRHTHFFHRMLLIMEDIWHSTISALRLDRRRLSIGARRPPINSRSVVLLSFSFRVALPYDSFLAPDDRTLVFVNDTLAAHVQRCQRTAIKRPFLLHQRNRSI